MLTTSLLATLFWFAPPEPPILVDNPIGTVSPPAARSIDVSESEGTFDDGTRYWTRTATYELASGDIGEAHLMITSSGEGSLQMSINGEAIAYAETLDSEIGAPHLSTWTVSETDYPAEVVVQLNQLDVGEELLIGFIPQEFKCSAWGRKAVRMAKYLWIGATGAAGAVCCMASTAGCPLCVAGAGMAGAAGADAANDYCE